MLPNVKSTRTQVDSENSVNGGLIMEVLCDRLRYVSQGADGDKVRVTLSRANLRENPLRRK